MSIHAIRAVHIDYDAEKKEVKALTLIHKTTGEKISKAVRLLFTGLWEIKKEIALGILAGWTCTFLGAPVGVSLIVSALVYFVSIRIFAIRRKRISSANAAYFQAAPVKMELLDLAQARSVNRILLKIEETKWGKRWLKSKDLKLDKAFKSSYFDLFKGTCSGQTHTLVKLMATHHAKSGAELLKGVAFDDVVRHQLMHNLSVDLLNWRDPKKPVFFPREPDLVKHHKRMNKVYAAQKEVLQEEAAIPGAEQKETLVLTDQIGKVTLFHKALKERLAALEKENPGKIIAGNIGLEYRAGGHSLFMQCNGGKYRLYDINTGLYHFPDQEALIAGFYRYLQRYESIKKIALCPFAVAVA